MKNLSLRCLLVLTLAMASAVFLGACQCGPPTKSAPVVHPPEGKEGPVLGNSGPHNNAGN
jgi:hypothetical protein